MLMLKMVIHTSHSCQSCLCVLLAHCHYIVTLDSALLSGHAFTDHAEADNANNMIWNEAPHLRQSGI